MSSSNAGRGRGYGNNKPWGNCPTCGKRHTGPCLGPCPSCDRVHAGRCTRLCELCREIGHSRHHCPNASEVQQRHYPTERSRRHREMLDELDRRDQEAPRLGSTTFGQPVIHSSGNTNIFYGPVDQSTLVQAMGPAPGSGYSARTRSRSPAREMQPTQYRSRSPVGQALLTSGRGRSRSSRPLAVKDEQPRPNARGPNYERNKAWRAAKKQQKKEPTASATPEPTAQNLALVQSAPSQQGRVPYATVEEVNEYFQHLPDDEEEDMSTAPIFCPPDYQHRFQEPSAPVLAQTVAGSDEVLAAAIQTADAAAASDYHPRSLAAAGSIGLQRRTARLNLAGTVQQHAPVNLPHSQSSNQLDSQRMEEH